MLSNLDDELDTILCSWTQTLLDNLDDPIIREQVTLLGSGERRLMSAFIESRTLPEDLDHGFVRGVRTLLSGLAKVVIATEDLREALLSGGSPATIDEMTTRFGAYLSDRAKGNDPDKVRLVPRVTPVNRLHEGISPIAKAAQTQGRTDDIFSAATSAKGSRD